MENFNLSKNIYTAFIITCFIIISYGLISQLIYGNKLIDLLEVFSTKIFFCLCIINISYLIRYFRWRFLIKNIGFKIPLKRDLINWFASLAFAATPAKIGEFVRLNFYNQDFNIPKSKVFSILFIEKISDLVSIVIISFFSFGFLYKINLITFYLFLLFIVFLIFVFFYKKKFLIKKILRKYLLKFRGEKFYKIYSSIRQLSKINILLISISAGVIGWFVECLSVYYLVNFFKEFDISIFKITFAHLTSTLVGVISFIPGGIGASEFTTTNIFLKYGVEIDSSIILAFAIRLITIWYATILGFLIFFIRLIKK